MALKTIILFWCIYFLTACSQQSISYKEIAHRTDASKDMIKVFGSKLKSKLQKALKSGGPLAAISVCHDQASKIAKELSKNSGWKIHRTSLKPRKTKPDAWESQIMLSFEKRHKDGDKFKSLFNQDIVKVNEKPVFRYMQAIETKQICLVCHGKNIAPIISNKIQQLYPKDSATGFKLSDIRGAFSIIYSTNLFNVINLPLNFVIKT